jgi:hypothetical protein
MSKSKPVVFVGDKASSKNVHPNIPFVGAGCESRLKDWIAYIDPSLYLLCNAHTIHNHYTEAFLSFTEAQSDFKFIALGQAASQALDAFSVPHFTLPHPSGLNRQLNDNQMIIGKLQQAALYINGGLRGTN